MAAFFALLPTDLQIDILYVWLNGEGSDCSLLKVLSALDSACSSADQAAFRFLLTQLPPFGMQQAGVYAVFSYLLWLSSRAVPLQAVRFFNTDWHMLEAMNEHGTLALSLPSIRLISWSAVDRRHDKVVLDVLGACPSLTSLEIDHQLVLTSTHIEHLPKLQTLIIFGEYIDVTTYQTMGIQLKELRASIFEFSAEMATCLLQFCPNEPRKIRDHRLESEV